MNGIILAAMILAGAAGPQPVASVPVTSVPEGELEIDPVGSCAAGGKRFDLRRVMFLENRSIDIDGPDGPLRISLDEDSINIEALGGKARRSTYVNKIPYEIGDDVDVQLKLALHDGKLVLYWKESFLYRTYRQGMFSIVGQDIAFLCEGNGGSWRSH